MDVSGGSRIKLSTAQIAGITVGVVIFVVGIIILTLWLTGVLFSSSDDNSSLVSVSVTPSVVLLCPTNGVFGSVLSTITGTTTDFGAPLTVTIDGEYLAVTNTNGFTETGGNGSVYQKSGDSYTLIDTDTFTPPTDTRSAFNLISPLGTHVLTGITNVNFDTTEQEFYRLTTKSGTTFFNNAQVLQDTTYPLTFSPAFLSDDELVVSFRDSSFNSVVKLYRFENETWTLYQTLTAPVGDGSSASFGASFTHAANVSILAISQFTPPRVNIYTRASSTDNWTFQTAQTITAGADAAALSWGSSIVMTEDGLTMAISDAGQNVGSNVQSGTVIIYRRDNVDDAFTLLQTINSQSPSTNQFFGIDLTLFGTTMFISINDQEETQRQSEIYTLNADTGTATFTQVIDWPHLISPATALVTGASSAFYIDDTDLILLAGYRNVTGENGTITIQKSACLLTT